MIFIRGLDFILRHFLEPVFPRKIMTKCVGHQVEIFSRQEGLDYFKASRYEDCRINAYPPYTSFHGINRTPVSFLMVDLDLRDFSRRGNSTKKKLLEKGLNKGFNKIKKESIGGIPQFYGQVTAIIFTNQ